ncbi:putative disease resistance protein RGA1 [Malus domestica]|uniref:putative disease resistance protein RGA1 n=1 Tax=Malus domestica TaxID=3750 RepID=UPI0004989DD5|nr:putative disease resistance protein RGA1 [Malus domestica]
MTQNYLNAKGNEDEGDTGDAIFDDLVAQSFFQDLKKDSVSGKIIGCKMHDIVYDFVQSLTKNECSIIDVKDIGNEIEVSGEKIHHLTLRLKLGEPLPPSNAYYNCQSLRTLSILCSSSPTTIDFNFILQMKCLSTLNLRNNGISKVPREIGDLIHLRHIDLSKNGGLNILPDNIILAKRDFEIKNLKTIDECVLVCGGDDDTATLRLGDLKFLNLQGSLSVRLKWNVKDEREIEKAQLWDMKQLFHLEINCEYDRYKKTTSTVEILNECKFLPPLGKLPYLENLTLWGMEKVKKVGSEFLGIVDEEDEMSLKSSSSSFFLKLKELKIAYMPALKEWEVGVERWHKEDSEISIMPCLSSLNIHHCESLTTLPDFLCKTPLQELTIYKCSTLSMRCEQGSGEE